MTAGRLPFDGHTVLRTRDIDIAEDVLSQCYLPLRLRGIAAQPPADVELTAVSAGEATIGALRFESGIRILTEEAANFHVDMPLSGLAVSRPGSAHEVVTRPGEAQVFMPGEKADLQWSTGTRQLCVMVQRAALENRLSALLGSEISRPLNFQVVMDLRSRAGRTYLHVLRLFDHELRRNNNSPTGGLMLSTLERLLVEALLVSHQHNYTRQLQQDASGSSSRAVRIAVDLLETYPERPWTASDLALEVGLGVRALQAGFQRTIGLGPMTYLRRIRLERVHRDLTMADPTTTTVSLLAHRWGFTHLGRFSAAYTRRYGQPPSATLHAGPPARGSRANDTGLGPANGSS